MKKHRQPKTELESRADELVAMTAPAAFFDDTHGPGQHPRCCELIAAIVATCEGMYEDAR